MEAAALRHHHHHDNKENIPPPVPQKNTNPVAVNVPSFKKCSKRRTRRPLADITHLFDSDALLPSFVSVCELSSWKRKASSSKSLRLGFR
ncbi:hypothetical protein FH972_014701 [Carpinus fangiana]|uniref:Uncharacterized protein n=1 Tax=Carpinus fangiana TaxID=176857 RepID=A0A5N6RCD4_9ROSI|nr:hypothetical protein FH972_014701 [Carpinus fangiana]